MAAILGDRFYWWIDPVGAIALAVYTIVNWSGTVLENAGMALKFSPNMHRKFSSLCRVCLSLVVVFDAVSLVGQSAPPEVLQKLTYLVLRHDPKIKRVDTVRAYTFGVLYFVEVRPLSANGGTTLNL